MKQSALELDRLPPQVLLADQHYLGPSHRSVFTYQDAYGVMVFAAPTSRRLPVEWLELVRWCLIGEVVQARQWDVIPSRDLTGPLMDRQNAGSRQWKACRAVLRRDYPLVTTVISYSDPSVGHTGALYRACNWLWAPTWQRLKPPPSGNGKWKDGRAESVKDRWIAVLAPDLRRASVLSVHDAKAQREMPWAEYREPKWKRGVPQLASGGGDYNRWLSQ